MTFMQNDGSFEERFNRMLRIFASEFTAYSTWIAKMDNAADIKANWRKKLRDVNEADWLRAVDEVALKPPVSFDDKFKSCWRVARRIKEERGESRYVGNTPTHNCPHCWDGSRCMGVVFIRARPGTTLYMTVEQSKIYQHDRTEFAVACVCTPSRDQRYLTFDPNVDELIVKKPPPGWDSEQAFREVLARLANKLPSNRTADGERKDRAPEYERTTT